MADQYGDIRKHIEYSDLRENFGRAARLGIESDCIWLKGKKMHVADLLKKELIPLAEHGLKLCKINKTDINKYMGVIKERVKKKTNGACWMLDSYSNLLKTKVSKDEVLTVLTHSIMKNQKTNTPIAKWKKADF